MLNKYRTYNSNHFFYKLIGRPKKLHKLIEIEMTIINYQSYFVLI